MPKIQDPRHQVSIKVRSSARSAITKAGRPLASHEITKWIRKNDTQLYRAISGKCADYVRIILSLTKDIFRKYKSVKLIRGIDRRTIFYGNSEEDYPPEEWISVIESQCNISDDQVEAEEVEKSFPVIEIDETTATNSWITLSRGINPTHPFWKELLSAIHMVDLAYKDSHVDIVTRATTQIQSIMDQKVLEHVTNILARETIIRRQIFSN